MVTLSSYLSCFEDEATLKSEFDYLMENSRLGLRRVLEYVRSGYGSLDDYSVFNAIVFDPVSLHIEDFGRVLADCRKYMAVMLDGLKGLKLRPTFKVNPRWVSFSPIHKAKRRGRTITRRDGVVCRVMQEVRVEVDKERCMKEGPEITGEFMADFISELVREGCVTTVNLPASPAYGLWRRDQVFLQVGDNCDVSSFGDIMEVFERTREKYGLDDVRMEGFYSVVEGEMGETGREYTQNEMAARFLAFELRDDAFRTDMLRRIVGMSEEECAEMLREKAHDLFMEKMFL